MSIDKVLPNRLPLPVYFYEKKSFNDVRRVKVMLFSDICNSYDEFKKIPYADKFKLIRRIERSCYNATVFKADEQDIRNTWSNPVFFDLYMTICMKISTNLEESRILFLKLLNGKIPTKKLAFMSSQELRPEMHAKIMRKIATRRNQVIQFKECNLYRCGKCKSNKCRSEKLYNRSLDEGVNLTITCGDCGHSWTA